MGTTCHLLICFQRGNQVLSSIYTHRPNLCALGLWLEVQTRDSQTPVGPLCHLAGFPVCALPPEASSIMFLQIAVPESHPIGILHGPFPWKAYLSICLPLIVVPMPRPECSYQSTPLPHKGLCSELGSSHPSCGHSFCLVAGACPRFRSIEAHTEFIG